MLNLREQIDKVYQNEVIVRFNLKDQASKILLKFIEHWQKDQSKYLSLAEVKRNFRTVTTEDARIIVFELEQMKIVVGKISKAQLVYKFNDNPTQWTNVGDVDVDGLFKFKELAKAKLNRKIERARKILQENNEPQPQLKQTEENLSPRELHELSKCGGKDKQCRFCLIEEGLGF